MPTFLPPAKTFSWCLWFPIRLSLYHSLWQSNLKLRIPQTELLIFSSPPDLLFPHLTFFVAVAVESSTILPVVWAPNLGIIFDSFSHIHIQFIGFDFWSTCKICLPLCCNYLVQATCISHPDTLQYYQFYQFLKKIITLIQYLLVTSWWFACFHLVPYSYPHRAAWSDIESDQVASLLKP